ncbi:MAG: DUF4058 family protein [Gemmataceae bacterium]
MPNPFPGMNPYLEYPGVWPDFHGNFIFECRRWLLQRLPRSYTARVGATVRLVRSPDGPDRSFLPDVGVTRLPGAPASGSAASAATVVLDPVTVTVPELVEEKEYEIRIVRYPDEQLVTVIELLSPTNKDAADVGHAEYAAKRRRLLQLPINLVEIDLLAGGTRPAIDQPWPAGDYFFLVSWAGERPRAGVKCWSVRDPLPTIPVPLAAGDPDLPLDLADVFRQTFDGNDFDRVVRYAGRFPAPLSDADRAWAEGVAGVAPPAA